MVAMAGMGDMVVMMDVEGMMDIEEIQTLAVTLVAEVGRIAEKTDRGEPAGVREKHSSQT